MCDIELRFELIESHIVSSTDFFFVGNCQNLEIKCLTENLNLRS